MVFLGLINYQGIKTQSKSISAAKREESSLFLRLVYQRDTGLSIVNAHAHSHNVYIHIYSIINTCPREVWQFGSRSRGDCVC